MPGQRPQRDAQKAWVEVARLKHRLQIAERALPSLIADDELRRRCQALLVAGGDYDRAVREACVVLKDRVRVAIAARSTLVGTSLMEQAFSQDDALRLVAFVDLLLKIIAAVPSKAGGTPV